MKSSSTLFPCSVHQMVVTRRFYLPALHVQVNRTVLPRCFSLRCSLPPYTGISSKRSRTSQPDDGPSSCASNQKLVELQQLVDQQAAEIVRLKAEKEAAEVSASELSAHHEKVEHENRILKRAVAIQQERQNQMASELESARRFKTEAEDRIRRLEQMNLTLQYQLQALTPSAGTDFLRFSPQPPDVY